MAIAVAAHAQDATSTRPTSDSVPTKFRAAVRISIDGREIVSTSVRASRHEDFEGPFRAVSHAVFEELNRRYGSVKAEHVPVTVDVDVERSMPLSLLTDFVLGLIYRAGDCVSSNAVLCGDPRLILSIDGAAVRNRIRPTTMSRFPVRPGYVEVKIDQLVAVETEGKSPASRRKPRVPEPGKAVVREGLKDWVGWVAVGAGPQAAIPVAVTLEGEDGTAEEVASAFNGVGAADAEVVWLIRTPLMLVGEVAQVRDRKIVVDRPSSDLGRQRLAVLGAHWDAPVFTDSIWDTKSLVLVGDRAFAGTIETPAVTGVWRFCANVLGRGDAPTVGQLVAIERVPD